MSAASGTKAASTPAPAASSRSRGRVRGYLARSSLGPNWVGLTKTDSTRAWPRRRPSSGAPRGQRAGPPWWERTRSARRARGRRWTRRSSRRACSGPGVGRSCSRRWLRGRDYTAAPSGSNAASAKENPGKENPRIGRARPNRPVQARGPPSTRQEIASMRAFSPRSMGPVLAMALLGAGCTASPRPPRPRRHRRSRTGGSGGRPSPPLGTGGTGGGEGGSGGGTGGTGGTPPAAWAAPAAAIPLVAPADPRPADAGGADAGGMPPGAMNPMGMVGATACLNADGAGRHGHLRAHRQRPGRASRSSTTRTSTTPRRSSTSRRTPTPRSARTSCSTPTTRQDNDGAPGDDRSASRSR